MDFAVSLIMACVFFRLFNVPVGGVDILPDMLGILFALAAVRLLRRGEDDFRHAYLPAGFALVLSLWNFINLMPTQASVGFALIYILLEGGLLIAETVMYKKLFDGFKSMYGEKCGENGISLIPYFISRACGVAASLAVWFGGADTELWWVSVCYFAWALINVVISTYLAYRFYLLKPKFRKK